MSGDIKKVVLPVAGLGTRFLPATKVMAKEMLPIVDKPLIQYAVEEAWEAGITEIVFVTGRGKAMLEDHFDYAVELENTLEARGKTAELELVRDLMPAAGKLAVVRQQAPLGLGHAVWCAKQIIQDEPFAVILPDDLVMAERGCLAQMIDAYKDVGGNMAAVVDVPREQTNRYGILDVIEDNGTLARASGLVEKPDPANAPSTLSIIGRYILQPEVFNVLDRQERGAGNEIQLTDAIAATMGDVPFHGLRFQGTRFDCGDKTGFVEANVAFALQRDDIGPSVKDALKKYL